MSSSNDTFNKEAASFPGRVQFAGAGGAGLSSSGRWRKLKDEPVTGGPNVLVVTLEPINGD